MPCLKLFSRTGGIDGSIYSLVPVRDIVFKRLQLLQAAMMRHVLHFAGLNPRGHRSVAISAPR